MKSLFARSLFASGAALVGVTIFVPTGSADENPKAPETAGAITPPASYFTTGGLSVFVPETVEVMRIKRPYLYLNGTVIVRVSDQEWQKLVSAYPKDALMNSDSSTELVFSAPKKSAAKSEK